MMTTAWQGGSENAECLGIVTAQCAFGPKAFAGAFAMVQPIVDDRSPAVEKLLQEGIAIVLEQLRDQAAAQDADAVVAVTIQYTPTGAGPSSCILLSAAGTAMRYVD